MKFSATGKPNAFDFTFPALTKEPGGAGRHDDAQRRRRPPPATVTERRPCPSPVSPTTATVAPARSATSPSATPPSQSRAGDHRPRSPVAPQMHNRGTRQISSTLAEAVDETTLPQALPALLDELTRRGAEVEQLVQTGDLGQVWLPAMGTKTVALALASQADSLAPAQRTIADNAAKQIVVSAWELDKYGDLGDKTKMSDAYQQLAAAITDLRSAYGSR